MVPVFLIRIITWCIQISAEIISIPKVLFNYFKATIKCPPIKDELLLLSATEVAQRVRTKQVTSTATVQAYIARINEVNPLINAVLKNRFKEALLEAQNVDDFILKTNLNEEELKNKWPLLGIPFTIKASIAVEGMLHTSGRTDILVKAKNDAPCVKHVRDSGAIPLLLSNVPEMCWSIESTNNLIGGTGNPYDIRRTPGGSSGGEASLIGCGASLIGIGSDIGGSLRLPSHYCGTWAHKPTPGVVSVEGHYPDCKNKDEWQKMFTMGPMVRYATDLKLLLSLMAQPEKKQVLQLEHLVDVKKVKIYYTDDPKAPLSHKFNNNVLSAMEKVITHFDLVCDSKCKKVKIPLMKFSDVLSTISLLTISGVDSIFDNKKHGGFCEFFKFFLGLSKHKLITITLSLLNCYAPMIFSTHMKAVETALQELRNEFLKILGDDGVFVIPVTSREATYRGNVFQRIFDMPYLAIFNALGFPSTACPVMFSKNGLPIGVQVVAAPNLDRLTLSVAEEIETAFGGWKFN